jgi:hypothetical protein
MKITETQLVVFCGDGKFRNLPLPQVMPVLGETIRVPEVVPVMIVPNNTSASKPFIYKSWLVAASFMVLVTASLLFNGMGIFHQPAAMVAIDINPSIELFVDDEGKVEEVSPINGDAEQMLRDVDLVGMDFYEAVNVILSTAEEQGYLEVTTDDKTMIMLAVVDYADHPFQVDLTKLSSGRSYDIALNYLDTEQQEKADQAKLSLNKYLIYETAQALGAKLNASELRELSIANAIARLGLDPDIFMTHGLKGKGETLPGKSDKLTDKPNQAERNGGTGDPTNQGEDEDSIRGQGINDQEKDRNHDGDKKAGHKDKGAKPEPALGKDADDKEDQEDGRNQNAETNKSKGQGSNGVTEQNRNNQDGDKGITGDNQEGESDKNDGSVDSNDASTEENVDSPAVDPAPSETTSPDSTEVSSNEESTADSSIETSSSTTDPNDGPPKSQPTDKKGK